MVIEFSCPQCKRLLRTSDEKAGRTAKCPDCQTPITVPQPGSAESDFSDEPAAFREQDGNTTPCPMCGAENDSWVKRCQSCGEDLTLAGIQTADGYIPLEYASIGSRFLAFIIDAIITGIIGGVFGGIAGAIMGNKLNAQEGFQLGQLIGGIVALIYYTVQESSEKQATIGKRAMSLTVATLDGQRLSFAHAVGRYFAFLLSQLLCVFFGATMWMAAFTEKKQTFHDMLSKTVVYKIPK